MGPESESFQSMDDETSIFGTIEPKIATTTQTVMAPETQETNISEINEIISLETMFNTETYDKVAQDYQQENFDKIVETVKPR